MPDGSCPCETPLCFRSLVQDTELGYRADLKILSVHGTNIQALLDTSTNRQIECTQCAKAMYDYDGRRILLLLYNGLEDHIH